MSEIRVLQNAGRVVLVINGRQVESMPYQKAFQLSKALHSIAKLAEEWESAEKIAEDNAILLRSGAPFGLSSHPLIKKESIQKALYDRNLRRYMQAKIPGIASSEIFGTPSLIKTPPRTVNNG